MRRHGNPSRRTLEKLLGAAGTSLAEFEALRFDPAAREELAGRPSFEDGYWGWNGAPLTPLTIVDCADADAWRPASLRLWRIDPGRAIARVPRPPSLAADRDAFALIVPGVAMSPRFRTGRTIAVSPLLTIAPGEDVLVRLKAESEGHSYLAIPGELRGSKSNGIEISQPGCGNGRISRDAVHSVAIIAGELI